MVGDDKGDTDDSADIEVFQYFNSVAFYILIWIAKRIKMFLFFLTLVLLLHILISVLASCACLVMFLNIEECPHFLSFKNSF